MTLATVAATSTPTSTGTASVPLAVSVVGIVLLAIIALIALLALTGFVAGRRRAEANRDAILARVREANHALAAAHAADEGWDPATLEATARDVARARGLAAADVDLVLIAVDDQPGVTDDRAVFQAVDGDRRVEIVLGRTATGWAPVD